MDNYTVKNIINQLKSRKNVIFVGICCFVLFVCKKRKKFGKNAQRCGIKQRHKKRQFPARELSLKIRCFIEFYLFSLLLAMRTRIAGRRVVKAVFTA